MNAQDLKSSILQRAIEGKLVPQRQEEGTAKELLAEIRAEKARLIKEKKIKKSKPLPEITDEEKPFDIPDSWEWARLGNLVSVLGGKRIPAGCKLTEIDTGHKYIRVSDMKNGSVVLSSIQYISEDIYQKIRKYTISENDIYITVAGTIGRIGTIPHELNNANLTENADKLVIYKMEKKFLCLALQSPFIQSQIKSVTTKVGQPKLAIKRIENFIVPVPPLMEQHRIVAKIGELQPDIDAYDKAQTKLRTIEQRFPDAMKKSLLQYAIEGKLVPQRKEEGTAKDLLAEIRTEKARLVKEKKIKKSKPLPAITDDEKPFDIPDNWEWVHLDDIVIKDIKRGKSPTYTVKSNILVFAQKCNTKKGYIDLSLAKFLDEEKFKKYPATEYMINDDIIINSTGTGTLGRVGFFQKENLDDVIVPDSHVTIIRTSKNSYARYVFYVLKANQPIFERMGEGSTKQKELRPSSLASFVIPLPPLAEQHRIVAKLEELLPLCQQLAANP